MIKRYYHIKVESKPQFYSKHLSNNEPVIISTIITFKSIMQNPNKAMSWGFKEITELDIVKSKKEEYIVTGFCRC